MNALNSYRVFSNGSDYDRVKIIKCQIDWTSKYLAILHPLASHICISIGRLQEKTSHELMITIENMASLN